MGEDTMADREAFRMANRARIKVWQTQMLRQWQRQGDNKDSSDEAAGAQILRSVGYERNAVHI